MNRPAPSAAERYAALAGALHKQRLPAALLCLERLEARAAQLLREAGDLPLRLLSSSLRCLPMLRHLLDLDPRWQGLLCHDPREAIWLAAQGLDDIVLSQPTLDPVQLRAIAHQATLGRRISLAIDDPLQIDAAEDAARELGCRLELMLDLHLGSPRAGQPQLSALREPTQAVRLAKRIGASNGLVHLRGVLAHRFAGDAQRLQPGLAGLAQRKRLERQQSLGIRRREAFLAALHDVGFEPELMLGALHPESGAERARGLTQLCVGDALLRGSNDELPPLLLALPVLRCAGDAQRVCHGGGLPLQVQLPGGVSLLRSVADGPVLRLDTGTRPTLGEPVFFSSQDTLALLERSEQLLVVREQQLVDRWPTYRGQQQLFL
ncbi:D-serine deaminase, pyridoxal phosphate-dependent [Solimonas aquatica]|uniref:D-serine deaminase, pyridoxal phosphate-dependent n=1 Tax=Solimonas aquatica TaxID=489703 RepID=A0A1H9KK21_9GAMM|nr:alanine racemase [Solimonas aquatica]SEQ99494.1 D-serine deaminase, pyridoxal phosphate-dependent [Solimonas aquatica]